jgi:hypothetical protein
MEARIVDWQSRRAGRMPVHAGLRWEQFDPKPSTGRKHTHSYGDGNVGLDKSFDRRHAHCSVVRISEQTVHLCFDATVENKGGPLS